MNQEDDFHELLQRIGNGDSLVFEDLDDKLRRPLTRYLWKKYSTRLSKEDIDDAVQYTLMQIWKQAGSYRGDFYGASAKSWIFRIADRHCWKLIEEVKKAPLSLDWINGNNEDGDEWRSKYEYDLPASEDTAQSAEAAILWREVMVYLRSLPERDRDVFLSRFEQGLTMKEIGIKIARKAPRVQQILNRILTAIKSLY